MYESNREEERIGPGPGHYQTFTYVPCSWEKAKEIADEVRRKRNK